MRDEEVEVEIRTTDDGGPLVIVSGELDAHGSRTLATAVDGLVDESTDVVVIDLAGVPFMDSTGFGAILGIHRAGAAVIVRNPSRQVRRLLDIVAVPGVVDVESS